MSKCLYSSSQFGSYIIMSGFSVIVECIWLDPPPCELISFAYI